MKKSISTVKIEEDVHYLFDKFRQLGDRPEKGGILLGKVKGETVIIQKASVPTLWDKSSRYQFIRHRNSAQLFTNYEFYNSNGTVIYLGEWHTHPEDYPSPSKVDTKMIHEQFHKNYINEPFLIMVIVGRKGNFYAVYDGHQLKEIDSH